LATNCRINSFPTDWDIKKDANVPGRMLISVTEAWAFMFQEEIKSGFVEMMSFYAESLDGKNPLILVGVTAVEGEFIDYVATKP